jgi:hypothetical protein
MDFILTAGALIAYGVVIVVIVSLFMEGDDDG